MKVVITLYALFHMNKNFSGIYFPLAMNLNSFLLQASLQLLLLIKPMTYPE